MVDAQFDNSLTDNDITLNNNCFCPDEVFRS